MDCVKRENRICRQAQSGLPQRGKQDLPETAERTAAERKQVHFLPLQSGLQRRRKQVCPADVKTAGGREAVTKDAGETHIKAFP